jgi:delta-aminolevulinic acid dehydratase/porphobilinogen synthase
MSDDWQKHDMDFLGGRRLRRTRHTAWSRAMVRETVLMPSDLIWPLFVIEGQNERTQIRTMPGVERLSVDLCVEAAGQHAMRAFQRWRCSPIRRTTCAARMARRLTIRTI